VDGPCGGCVRSFGDPAAYLHEPDHPHMRVPDFSGACEHCTPPVHGEVVFVKCTDAETGQMRYSYGTNPPPPKRAVSRTSARRTFSRRTLDLTRRTSTSYDSENSEGPRSMHTFPRISHANQKTSTRFRATSMDSVWTPRSETSSVDATSAVGGQSVSVSEA
jgi:hypothetical protein